MTERLPARVAIAAIDPGLDATGVVVFQVDPGVQRYGVVDKINTIHRLELIRTTPADGTLSARCGVIWRDLYNLCVESKARIAYVETPARAGRYAARVARDRSGEMTSRSMLGFHAACGAIYAALYAAQAVTIERPAARLDKPTKRALVNAWIAQARGEPVSNQDIADAIFVGMRAEWLRDLRYLQVPRTHLDALPTPRGDAA